MDIPLDGVANYLLVYWLNGPARIAVRPWNLASIRYPVLLPVVIISINLWITPHVDFWVSAVINGFRDIFCMFHKSGSYREV